MTNNAMKSLRDRILSTGIQNVVIGDLPELQESCIAIRPVDGYPSTLYLGMPETMEPLVEVITRNKSYEEGTDMYNKALKALNKYSDTSAGILLCVVTGSPGYLGRNTNDFGEWHFILHVSVQMD